MMSVQPGTTGAFRSATESRRTSSWREWVATVVFWGLTAAVVGNARTILWHAGLTDVIVVVLVKILAVAVGGFLLSRVVHRGAGIDAGLLAGPLWLALSIVAELAVTSIHRASSFELLGGPALPAALRNVLMLTWIAAPELGMRGRVSDPDEFRSGKR